MASAVCGYDKDRISRNFRKEGNHTMKIKRVAALFGLFLALCLLAGCGGETVQTPDAPPSQDPAPAQSQTEPQKEAEPEGAAALGQLAAFTAETLQGGTFTQDDIAAKDVTAVNFWSLTCGPCIAEMPDLAAYAKALPDNVQLITVCLDGKGNEAVAAQILEECGFEGVTLVSGDGDLLSLCANLMYTPTTVFADSQGQLVGEAIIGGQRDLFGTYTAAVNQVLAAGGKAEISVESE